MKGRFAAALLALGLGLGSFCGAAAACPAEIVYDGRVLPVTGALQEGTTYVPLRQFCQLMGENQVTWDGAQRCAAVQGGVNAAFYAESSQAWLNGQLQTLTGTSYLDNNVFYVPLRGLAGAMDCGISYDGENRRVVLTSNHPTEGGPETGAQDDELYWLSRIIQAESGGEPYAGKLAVGEVILNRVASDDFPNTVYEVIFDREYGVQFTPTENGTIYQTPSAESLAAARECLAGSSTVGDSLYFFNPVTATKAGWIVDNCVFYTSIGNHDFYAAN